ncbi:putative ferric-chelate reductase 1 homolog [Chironomus tepperi]|uniref:putative ferric-chelate reductase 1 homolog n=1 Tax=Chironomus tepperi TaxID=113505 RepID=UPI00391F11FE
MFRYLILLVILCVHNVLGFPQGAVSGTCGTMVPVHQGHQPQQGTPPVTVIVPDQITAGSQISVIIRANPGQGFAGYKILARDQDNNFIGRFLPTTGVGLVECGEIQGNAATHTNREAKTEVVLTWEAPQIAEITTITFFVTIVQSFAVFWVNYQTSSTIVPSYDVYQGCGITKTCFGIPSFCVPNRNCAMLAAVTYDNPDFTFELLSTANHNYVAMGLSNSQSMGDSSVIECVRLQAGIQSFKSWTIGITRAERSNIDANIIDFIAGWDIDGRIYCKVQRIPESVVRGVTFDLVNSNYYLLLAGGMPIGPTGVGMHANEGVSHARILLTEPQIVDVETSKNPLKLTHGALMIISWIGLSSIGIVVARYFKKTWPDTKLGGKDPWFIWHSVCMGLTFVLTIAGFITIFVYCGEWRTSAHAIMGCIVLAFTVIQPIGAMFRPDPNDAARPLFNWFHKAFGNIAHALAIITIFFAVRFPRVGLPYYTLYILAAFVSFYLLMHIIFMAINIRGQMKRDSSTNSSSKKQPYQVLLKTLLGLFILVILAFVVILCVVFMMDFE